MGSTSRIITFLFIVACAVYAPKASASPQTQKELNDFHNAKNPTEKFEAARSSVTCNDKKIVDDDDGPIRSEEVGDADEGLKPSKPIPGNLETKDANEMCKWLDTKTKLASTEFNKFIKSLSKAELDMVLADSPRSVNHFLTHPFSYLINKPEDCTKREFDALVKKQGKAFVVNNITAIATVSNFYEDANRAKFAKRLLDLAKAKKLASENQVIMMKILELDSAIPLKKVKQSYANLPSIKTYYADIKKLAAPKSSQVFVRDLVKQFPNCLGLLDSHADLYADNLEQTQKVAAVEKEEEVKLTPDADWDGLGELPEDPVYQKIKKENIDAFDFRNVDIREVLPVISQILERKTAVDDDVHCKLVLSSPPAPLEKVIQLLIKEAKKKNCALIFRDGQIEAHNTK